MNARGTRRTNAPGEVEASWDHEHALVVAHPVTGRRALWTAPANVQGPAGAQDLVEACLDAAVGAVGLFRLRYGDGDVVLWDDRCMMHSVTPVSPAARVRILHRCGTELRAEGLREKTFQYDYMGEG